MPKEQSPTCNWCIRISWVIFFFWKNNIAVIFFSKNNIADICMRLNYIINTTFLDVNDILLLE